MTEASKKTPDVSIYIKGARLTDRYIITPRIGTSKNGPLERWIDKLTVTKFSVDRSGVKVTAPPRVFESRGIELPKPPKKEKPTAVAE